VQHAVRSSTGRTENARFLEQYRYIIITSQLLTEHASGSYYDLKGTSPISEGRRAGFSDVWNYQALCATGIAAFSTVWVIHWARGGAGNRPSIRKLFAVLLMFAVFVAVSYRMLRRQWLQYIRRQVVKSTSLMIENSQGFDIAATTAITLVQEVELVSRGYRM
jgi:Mysoin-binding motif of peroxisomes